jgi:hypothetical protein
VARRRATAEVETVTGLRGVPLLQDLETTYSQ